MSNFLNNTSDLEKIYNEVNGIGDLMTEQDDLIAQIANALECKTGASGGTAKTTKTINLDWSMDEEYAGLVEYISNNKKVTIYCSDGIETIEAEGGIVFFNEDTYTSDNFIYFNGVYIATQDGETIYFVSSDQQQ